MNWKQPQCIMPSRRSYCVSSFPARPIRNDHQQQQQEQQQQHRQRPQHQQEQEEQEDGCGASTAGVTANKRRRITSRTSFHSCSSSCSSSSSSDSSSSSCSSSSFSSSGGGGDRSSDRRRDDVPSNDDECHQDNKQDRNDHRTTTVRRTVTSSCTSTTISSSIIAAAGRQDHQNNKQVTCPLVVVVEELPELQDQERHKGQAAGVQAKHPEETRNRSKEEWPQQQQKTRMGRRTQQQDEQQPQEEAYSRRRYYYHQHNQQHYDHHQNRNIVLVDNKNHQIQQHEDDEEQEHRYQHQQERFQEQEVQSRPWQFPSSLWQKQPLSGVVPRTEYHTSTTSNASNSVRGSYDAFLTKEENIHYPLQLPKQDVMMDTTAMGRNKGDIVYYTVYQPCTFHTAFSLSPWKEGASADLLSTTRNYMEPAIRVIGPREYQQQTEDAKISRPIGSAIKEAPSSTPIAIEPSENDVISGRGNGANRRVGNIRFREIVSEYKNMYNYAKSTMDKRRIAMAVIRDIEIQNPPGRFLQKNEMTQTWQVLERRCVLRKVLQALREPVQDKKHRMMKANSKSLPPPKYSTDSPEANNLKMESELFLPLKVVQNPERSTGESYVTVVNRQAKPAAAEQCRSNLGSDYNGRTFDEQTDYDSSLDDIMAESDDICPPFLANQANFAFVFNYENMTIKSFIDHATEQDECKNEGSLREDDNDMLFHSNNQLLRDISVVASTCRDLTPLYVMVRTGSSVFSTIRSTNNKHLPGGSSNKTTTIVPSQNDILVNATEIHNHTGNLRLAECIQHHFHEYMKVQQSGADHGGQQVLLLELLIGDIVKMCTAGDNEGTRSNRFSPFESPTKCYPNGRFLVRRRSRGDIEEQNFCSSEYFSSSGISWMLLTENDVKTMIISLFHQAASFILKPHPNDVLLNRRDVSRLSPGNMYFRSIVHNFKEFHTAPSSPEKEIEMAVEIVGLVISRRSRFLAYVKGMGMWMPLTFQNAVKKTRQLLSFQLKNGVPFANL